MEVYIVEKFIPICTELIDNWYDKQVNRLHRAGYDVENVESFEDLKSGQRYLDSKGKIQVKK